MYSFGSAIALERFHISFSIKPCFYETNIFISRTKQNYTKPLTISERASKIKVILPSTLFRILPMSAVICKQKLLHETRLYNFFKTTNAVTSNKATLENLRKVLQIAQKFIS